MVICSRSSRIEDHAANQQYQQEEASNKGIHVSILSILASQMFSNMVDQIVTQINYPDYLETNYLNKSEELTKLNSSNTLS